MGLFNAPATFESLMNRIFYYSIDGFRVVYMDYLRGFSAKSSLNTAIRVRRPSRSRTVWLITDCKIGNITVHSGGFIINADKSAR